MYCIILYYPQRNNNKSFDIFFQIDVGIGRATVEAFIKEGGQVIAVDMNAEKLETLRNKPG